MRMAHSGPWSRVCVAKLLGTFAISGDEVHRVAASLAVKLHDRLGQAGSQRYPAVAATFPAAIDRESTCQRGVSRGLAPRLMPGSGKSSV